MLSELEIRVLGWLIEKQITTPELLRLGGVLNIALMSGHFHNLPIRL